VLPTAAILIVLGLVFLLPQRGDRAGPSAGGAPAHPLPRLELDEPPAWAVQRGSDEILRQLDRLEWGNPMALRAAFEQLEKHRGTLAPELLSRLRALGDARPVLSSKLLELLAGEDPETPGLMDEFVLRALSDSSLEAQTALRALADVRHPRALDGILPRLMDADLEVRGFARAALAQQARQGNAEAQAIVLAELDLDPAAPDLAFLAVLDHLGEDERVTELLRRIVVEAPPDISLIARTALVRRGDPEQMALFEEMMAGDDPYARINALRGLAAIRMVLGWEHWRTIARRGEPEEVLPLAEIMQAAMDSGHPQAVLAADLLETLATDPTNGVHVEITTRLYQRLHPWAVEATRVDIQEAVGGMLTQTVDRVIDGPAGLQPDAAELARQRLASDASLREGDRLLLCRLLAHVAPDASAGLLVDYALGRQGASPELAALMPTLLTRVGLPALDVLERELGDPEADALYVRIAGDLRSGAALPGLERILMAEDSSRELKLAALESVALLREGNRAELVRAAAQRWSDPELRERARLVFWNYL
jgi:hypothetical protein